jgi:hypothetical protein
MELTCHPEERSDEGSPLRKRARFHRGILRFAQDDSQYAACSHLDGGALVLLIPRHECGRGRISPGLRANAHRARHRAWLGLSLCGCAFPFCLAIAGCSNSPSYASQNYGIQRSGPCNPDASAESVSCWSGAGFICSCEKGYFGGPHYDGGYEWLCTGTEMTCPPPPED